MTNEDMELTDSEIESIIARALADNPHWQPDAWGLFNVASKETVKKVLSKLSKITYEQMVEIGAKWLASICENGEPYENYQNMNWTEFNGGEKYAEGYRDLFRTILPVIQAEKAKAVEKAKKEVEDKYKSAIVKALPPRYLRKVIEALKQGE